MKEVAVADVEEVTAYVLYNFDGFLSCIEGFHPYGVDLYVWCERVVKFHLSVYSCPIFPAPFIEDTVFFPPDVFPALSKISCPKSRGSISGFCILFHWSMCLFLCQYHAVFVITAL